MIYIPEVPETLHSQRERGRLTAQGRRSDDNSNHTLLIINEADGSWTLRGTLVSSSQACPPDCDHDHPVCPECVCEAERAVGRWIAR